MRIKKIEVSVGRSRSFQSVKATAIVETDEIKANQELDDLKILLNQKCLKWLDEIEAEKYKSKEELRK